VLLVLCAAAAVDPTDEELRARIVRTSLLEEAVLLGEASICKSRGKGSVRGFNYSVVLLIWRGFNLHE
jgi:hypothetical protein